MNSDIKYTIIIPTLNQSAKLAQCLSHLSLLDFEPDLFEVLVVDNGSTDDTKEKSYLFREKIKNMKYIFCESPGLMAARHKGCDAARGEILCYIDDDTLVTEEWLKGVDESFADEDVAITGGPCIPEYEKTSPEWISYFWYKSEYGMVNWFLSLIDFGNNELIINPVYIFGCNYSIRKTSFLRFGGTNPDYLPGKYRFYQGDGESGLSKKIYMAGFKTIYKPRAKIFHLIPETRLTVDYFCARRFFNGIHASYSSIRKEHNLDFNENLNGTVSTDKMGSLYNIFKLIKKKMLDLKYQMIPNEPRVVMEIRKQIEKNFEEGFKSHQRAVNSDPRLFEWVLREDYLGENGRLPELD